MSVYSSLDMSIYLINKDKLFATNSSPLTNPAASNFIYIYVIFTYIDVSLCYTVVKLEYDHIIISRTFNIIMSLVACSRKSFLIFLLDSPRGVAILK